MSIKPHYIAAQLAVITTKQMLTWPTKLKQQRYDKVFSGLIDLSPRNHSLTAALDQRGS